MDGSGFPGWVFLFLIARHSLASAGFVARYSSTLDQHGDVVLFWDFDNDSITFELHAKTLGFVGFGISPNGAMTGSDVIIGWVNDGRVEFKDRHASGNSEPAVDRRQDWRALWGRENDTHTLLRFTRKLNTCDPDDRPIRSGTTRLIWALGDAKADPAPQPTGLSIHEKRGTRSLMLLNADSTAGKNLEKEQDVVVWELVHSNMNVPYFDTYYGCRGFRIPDFINRTKHHVIAIAPFIVPSMVPYVHHILVYACPEHFSDAEFEKHGKKNYGCYQNSRMDQCRSVIFSWGVGAMRFTLPENVGLPIGGPDEIPKIKFVRLEIHYDNPNQVEGLLDNSGLKIFLTKKLRKEEAGISELGVRVNSRHVLPPGEAQFSSFGVCHQSCLEQGLESGKLQSVNVFAVLQHSHLAGRKIRVRHFRDGKELEPIFSDEFYDFNFQSTIFRDKEVAITKGDSLAVECVTSTVDRNVTTFGGLSTRHEMCLAYLYTRPRLPLAHCQSLPTVASLLHSVPGFAAAGLDGHSDRFDWRNRLPEVKWTSQAVAQLQETVRGGNVTVFCDFVGKDNAVKGIDLVTPKLDLDLSWDTTNCSQRSPNGAPAGSSTCFPGPPILLAAVVLFSGSL